MRLISYINLRTEPRAPLPGTEQLVYYIQHARVGWWCTRGGIGRHIGRCEGTTLGSREAYRE